MKKSVLALAVVPALLLSSTSFAEYPDDEPMERRSYREMDSDVSRPRFDREARGGRMMEDEEDGGERGRGFDKKDEMRRMGMHRQVVATNDGGIVVISGSKMAKYDAVLTFVNEVDLGEAKKGSAVDPPAPAPAKTPPVDDAPAAVEPSPSEGRSVEDILAETRPVPARIPSQVDPDGAEMIEPAAGESDSVDPQ